ncbi:MAG: response regulator, partial [Gammaproteobacteria bacterium]|nr:response regulator [Gammaproteobacteria bacterium]
PLHRQPLNQNKRRFIQIISEKQRFWDRLYLMEAGFQIVQAQDGDEALDILKSNPEDFAVIVTDQIMPHVSGLDLMRAMKQLPPIIDKIPIIMLTAISDEEGKNYLTERGIFQYVVKPPNPSLLIDAVKRAYRSFISC